MKLIQAFLWSCTKISFPTLLPHATSTVPVDHLIPEKL